MLYDIISYALTVGEGGTPHPFLTVMGINTVKENQMKEIWKDIEGYADLYRISNYGNVYSFGNSKNVKPSKMKGWINKYGYRMVDLYKDKKCKHHFVSRLVAQHFIDNSENKKQVNHIDGDKLNNRVNNLEWVTGQENKEHAVKLKLHPHNETHGMAKLTNEDVKKIRLSTLKNSEIAKLYNVTRNHIARIKKYKLWRNL